MCDVAITPAIELMVGYHKMIKQVLVIALILNFCTINAIADPNVPVYEHTMKNGDIFTVSLNESPCTGFIWHTTYSSGLDLVSSKYIPLSPKKAVHEFKFKAVSTGQQTVTETLSEINGPSVDTRIFILRVI